MNHVPAKACDGINMYISSIATCPKKIRCISIQVVGCVSLTISKHGFPRLLATACILLATFPQYGRTVMDKAATDAWCKYRKHSPPWSLTRKITREITLNNYGPEDSAVKMGSSYMHRNNGVGSFLPPSKGKDVPTSRVLSSLSLFCLELSQQRDPESCK